MQIGRKLYYEKLTGNVILATGEREGDVLPTTTEQDFDMFAALQTYVPEAVGCVQLEYGQYADKFGVYHYHIDQETESIVWGDRINPEIPEPLPPLEEQIAELKQQNKELQQQNLVIMEALATLYEDIVLGGGVGG